VRLCSGVAHGDFWTTISAADRVDLAGAPAGIAHLKIEASMANLYTATVVAVGTTKHGWKLFDERRRSPH
jgi:hypothetical protein